MSAAPSLSDLADRFPRARVLVLGDVMLDRFVYGEVGRVSPEAPIPVLQVRHQEAMAGGAGNVAANAAALGASVTLLGAVGDDAAGAELQALLQGTPGLSARLVAEPSRPTTVKARYIAGSQQLLRADTETVVPVAPQTAAALLAGLEAALAEADVVVFSDYAKGTLSDDVLGPALERCHAAGRPVIADPKRRDLVAYAGAALVTPNLRELEAAVGRPCQDDAAVEAAARELLRRCAIGALLVTRSAQGLTLVPSNGAAVHVAGGAREVFDVSGAGDSVLATLAVAQAAGAEPDAAARLANLSGGIVVGKVGTAVVRRDELLAALREQEVLSSEAKIVGPEAALEAVRQWRARGLKVGFTNGCFDLVHAGHVALLKRARGACDRLVVGLNSDDSVRRLKGEGRPVQHETGRAIVLASLLDVDLVVVFAEDTPLRLIRTLKPDLLVKGADYTVDQVVGAAEVQGWGGEVLLVRLVEGHSTTRTIAAIAGRAAAGRE